MASEDISSGLHSSHVSMDGEQPIIREGGAEILPCPDNFPQTQGVMCLPFHFDGEHTLYSTHTPTVEKLIRQAGLEVARPNLPGQTRYRDERSLEWMGPVLFFSAAALAQNPEIMSVSIGVIANYVTELFRGRSEPSGARLAIIEEVEGKTRYRRIEYRGTAEGLRALPASIRAAYKDPAKDRS